MDSGDSGGGVHVWSIPFGYCDDESTELDGTIKDEEVVLGDTSGSALDHDSLDAGRGALDPGSDPLSLDADEDDIEDLSPPREEISLPPRPAAVLHPAQPARVPDVSLWLGPPTAGPSSVASVPDDSSAESADSGHDGGQELAMSFKAEPEDDHFLYLDPTSESPPPPPVPALRPPRPLPAIGRDPVRPGESPDELPVAPDPDMDLKLIDPLSGRDIFRCKVCRCTFKLKTRLDLHYRQLHPAYRPWVCGECGNRYHRESLLRYHEMLHNDQREFACSSCEKRFVTNARLAAHLRNSRLCPASESYDEFAVGKRRKRLTGMSLDEATALLRRQKKKGVKIPAARRPPAPTRPLPEEVWLDSDVEECVVQDGDVAAEDVEVL